MRYTAGSVDYTADDLHVKAMDEKTRKLINMNGALHPRADVNRLNVTRGGEGRDSMSVEDVVRVEEHSLLDYLNIAQVNSDRLLSVVGERARGTDYRTKVAAACWHQKLFKGSLPSNLAKEWQP